MRNVLSKLKYYAATLLFLLTSTVLSVGPTMTAHAAPAGKVFVCKYVGTPGTDERLQTGNNPIDVSINAIKDYNGPGSYFNDQQGRSYVLALDTGQDEPDVSQCPAAQGPTPVTPLAVTFNDPCGTINDAYTVPTTAGVTYSATAGTHAGTGTVTVTATANSGFVLNGGSTWSHTFDTTSCVVPLTPATPADVTFNDVCGTNGDTFTVPTTTGVNYSASAGTHAGSGTVTVTATAQAGYVLTGTTTWSHTFNTDPCDVCSNLEGVQTEVPKGFKLVDGTCQPKKVYVCKYVGTPGVDERLQTGQNPIDVSVNSINVDPVEVGSTFSDAQGRSVVIAFDEGQEPPTAEDCETPTNQPTVVATADACAPPTVLPAGTSSVTVTVTNPNTYEVTYTVTLGQATQEITLAAGANGDVTFTGLVAGDYTADVSGDDDTSGSASATITTCPVNGGGGHVLGASTTAPAAPTGSVLSDTGVNILVPTIMAILTGATATGVMLSSRRTRKTSLFSNQSNWQIP